MSRNIVDMENEFMADIAARFKLLSHPARLKILALLEKSKLSVSDIQVALGMPQPKVSQHLLAMRNHGILGYEQDGSRHYYFIKNRNVCGILRCIEKAYSEKTR